MTPRKNPTADGGQQPEEGMNQETNEIRLPEPEQDPKVIEEAEPITAESTELPDEKVAEEQSVDVVEKPQPTMETEESSEESTAEPESPAENQDETIVEDEQPIAVESETVKDESDSEEQKPAVDEGEAIPTAVDEPIQESPTDEVQKIEDTIKEAEPVSEDSAEEITAEESPSEVVAEVETEAVEEKEEEEDKSKAESDALLKEVMDEHDEEDEEEEHTEEEIQIPDYKSFSKEQMVEAMEELVKADDITSIKKNISLLRIAFHDLIGSEHEQQVTSDMEEVEGAPQSPQEDDLNLRFEAAFGIYKEKKHKQDEEFELQKQQNLEAKNAILEELRVLIASDESLKKTYDEFRDLQQKWKDIGVVPRNEVANLWQNYHFLVEKFFDKVRINKELRDLDLKKNLEEKISLCEKAEELLLDTSITRSFKLLQQYHTQWKEIGPVPQENRDEIWERFKSASEKINKRRREFYVELKEDQENNLGAKLALCDKIEELLLIENKSIKDWNVRTDHVKEMFNLWKAIGPGPKKENDAAWERFKSGVDRFYAEKAEYFSKIKEEQLENYNRKVDICVQAEAIKDSNDWKGTTNALIHLQKEWKEIGPVSRKNADKIWKRFRAACDEFFKRKNEFFANIKEHEQENLDKKKELIKRVAEYEFSDDKNENLKKLKEFQREWMEIGYVPMKEKDAIQAEFRKAIDMRMGELQISSSDIAEMNYKARLDRMMDAPDSNRLMGKERMHLQNKITALQNEINLWENNLGFLAASKKADLLKKEFEAKIKKAKDEVALMKAQLKLLRDR